MITRKKIKEGKSKPQYESTFMRDVFPFYDIYENKLQNEREFCEKPETKIYQSGF